MASTLKPCRIQHIRRFRYELDDVRHAGWWADLIVQPALYSPASWVYVIAHAGQEEMLKTGTCIFLQH